MARSIEWIQHHRTARSRYGDIEMPHVSGIAASIAEYTCRTRPQSQGSPVFHTRLPEIERPIVINIRESEVRLGELRSERDRLPCIRFGFGKALTLRSLGGHLRAVCRKSERAPRERQCIIRVQVDGLRIQGYGRGNIACLVPQLISSRGPQISIERCRVPCAAELDSRSHVPQQRNFECV